MNIYIIGSGGVGGYFGAKLALAGNNVTFVARGAHFQAMKQKGLRVTTAGGELLVKPVKVIESISEIINPDLLFFSVKTYDTLQTARQLASVLSEGTVVITFQNGVENDKMIQDILQNSKVFPGVAYVFSQLTNPGIIEQKGDLHKIIFGARDKQADPILQEFDKLARLAGIESVYSDDITRDLWKKFVFITAFSGITALTRSAIGPIRDDPHAYLLYRDCIIESLSVAKALNVDLPENILEQTLATTEQANYNAKSSLLNDIEHNHPNEIETLNGTLVRLAEENGIMVPINRAIYSAIKLLDHRQS